MFQKGIQDEAQRVRRRIQLASRSNRRNEEIDIHCNRITGLSEKSRERCTRAGVASWTGQRNRVGTTGHQNQSSSRSSLTQSVIVIFRSQKTMSSTQLAPKKPWNDRHECLAVEIISAAGLAHKSKGSSSSALFWHIRHFFLVPLDLYEPFPYLGLHNALIGTKPRETGFSASPGSMVSARRQTGYLRPNFCSITRAKHNCQKDKSRKEE